MLSCKETTQLISESFDKPLPLHQKAALKLHTLMCRLCGNYQKQMRFIEIVMNHMLEGEKEDTSSKHSDACLSAETRERLKRLLKRDSENSP